jgi:hypothetical protein
MRAVMRALRVVAPLAVLLALPVDALAWTAPTRVRMVDDAMKLLPPTLRKVLEKRRKEVLRGMLLPMTAEDAAGHRPPWDRGSLDASVEAATRELVASVGTSSFDEVAEHFGGLAHYVADAGFPPGAGGSRDEKRYAHFAAFAQTRRERFPLVFYGHDSQALARGDLKGFASEAMERARAEDSTLARAYAAAPSWDDPIAFDDRSVPFALASLSYSHAVTDIVQAWVAAWSRCHGDLGGTPYRSAAH